MLFGLQSVLWSLIWQAANTVMHCVIIWDEATRQVSVAVSKQPIMARNVMPHLSKWDEKACLVRKLNPDECDRFSDLEPSKMCGERNYFKTVQVRISDLSEGILAAKNERLFKTKTWNIPTGKLILIAVH